MSSFTSTPPLELRSKAVHSDDVGAAERDVHADDQLVDDHHAVVVAVAHAWRRERRSASGSAGGGPAKQNVRDLIDGLAAALRRADDEVVAGAADVRRLALAGGRIARLADRDARIGADLALTGLEVAPVGARIAVRVGFHYSGLPRTEGDIEGARR